MEILIIIIFKILQFSIYKTFKITKNEWHVFNIKYIIQYIYIYIYIYIQLFK